MRIRLLPIKTYIRSAWQLSIRSGLISLACIVMTSPVVAQQLPAPANLPVITAGSLNDVLKQEREVLFSRLTKTADAGQAATIAGRLRELMKHSGSASIDLMMRWANLALDQARDKEAEDFIAEIITLRGDYAPVWELQSRLFLRRNHFDAAQNALKRALLLEPRNFDLIISYATLLREDGNQRAAAAMYQQALTIYPAMRLAQNELLKLNDELQDIHL